MLQVTESTTTAAALGAAPASVETAPPAYEEADDDDGLPDLHVRPPSGTVTATVTARRMEATRPQSRSSKVTAGKSVDDALQTMADHISNRRPAADQMRDLMSEQQDKRTVYCQYLASEVRDYTFDDWNYFQQETFRTLVTVRTRQAQRMQRPAVQQQVPPQVPPPLQQPLHQPLQHLPALQQTTQPSYYAPLRQTSNEAQSSYCSSNPSPSPSTWTGQGPMQSTSMWTDQSSHSQQQQPDIDFDLQNI